MILVTQKTEFGSLGLLLKFRSTPLAFPLFLPSFLSPPLLSLSFFLRFVVVAMCSVNVPVRAQGMEAAPQQV